MAGLKNLWSTRAIQRQQWNAADETELQKLARSPTGLTQDTTYSYAMHQDAELVNANKSNNHQIPARYWSGWRFGAINCAISASIVFLINFIVTIWGSVHNKSKGNVLFDGDCEQARKLNTGLHFLINVLSTILLSSSNYCMQILSAPTRKEIDAAHAKGQWMDIGVPSIHNLRKINVRRAILWLLLGFSSLPLHLFYNSTVFLSISSNDYIVANVRESFLSKADCGDCGRNASLSSYTYLYTENTTARAISVLQDKARNNELERLDNADCIREYATMIQSTRRNVFLVAADSKMPEPNKTINGLKEIYSLSYFSASDTQNPDQAGDIYRWICSDNPEWWSYPGPRKRCTELIDSIKSAPKDWKVGYTKTYPVDYCLSEKAEPHCKLQFTLGIAILVTLLNLFKAILIFYTAIGIKENPLLTMGDAVASFLEKRDETTKGMCLLSVSDVKSHRGYFPAGPKEWTGKVRRWKDVTSRTRRLVTFAMFTIMLIIITVLLSWGIRALPEDVVHSIPGVSKLGYGAIDPRTIISFYGQMSTTSLVLIANIAQPILSFLYFSYNGLFTAMLLGFEWVSYAVHRKGLRVSRLPEGAQRSTYFLQLPYRFALPLMALSGVLHWLVSQSIFLVAIDTYNWDGSTDIYGDWKSCGYSPIAIFTTLMLGILMTLSAVGVGWVPFKPGMNLAGSCSAAISAACHGLDESDAHGYEKAISKLQWGVAGTNADGIGHCTFSTKEVEMPKVGQMYAGIKTGRSNTR